MSGAAQQIRQLQIKTGVVKRYHKEVSIYRKEAEDQARAVEKLKADGADEWTLKNGAKVQAESEGMIPRTEQNLAKAVEELEDLVDAGSSEEEIASSAEWKAAKAQLEAVKA